MIVNIIGGIGLVGFFIFIGLGLLAETPSVTREMTQIAGIFLIVAAICFK